MNNNTVIPTTPVKYVSMHWRLTRYLGKAAGYPCVNCSQPAKEWALRWDITPPERLQQDTVTQVRPNWKPTTYKVTWSNDCADYDPLCLDCHRKLDKIGSLR